jgi:quinolinate synthase
VLAIKDTHPESPPKISPIDEALGVTDKLLREVTVKLDREVVVIAIVGRIGDNWRVLNLF